MNRLVSKKGAFSLAHVRGPIRRQLGGVQSYLLTNDFDSRSRNGFRIGILNIFMGRHCKNPNKEILVAILVSSLGLREQFYPVSQSQPAWLVGQVIIWIKE